MSLDGNGVLGHLIPQKRKKNHILDPKIGLRGSFYKQYEEPEGKIL